MKSLLGIVGSPRRNGNTAVLVSRLLEGARAEGASTGIVFLGDLTIGECDGCHACWRGLECVRRDDMNALYPRIMEADVLVFGTPVYWWGPTALMKALIDRFVYFNCPGNRARISGKSAAAVIPLEETEPDSWAPVADFFIRAFRYLEMNPSGILAAPGVTGRSDAANRPELMDGAFELGRSLVRGELPEVRGASGEDE